MYIEKELVSVGKRENNRKRNYLVVNPLQGKHIPVRPGKALELFDVLAGIVKDAYNKERLLVIGFAETATAIGAEVAIRLGERYIQTTREEIPQAEYIYFSEAHSHATEQKLVKKAVDRAIGEVDRIVFVEDEVTTGNTILSIVGRLEEMYGRNIKFAVASILNGMTKEHMRVYEEKGIRCHYILKTSHKDYGRIADQFAENGSYEACDASCRHEIDEVRFTGWMDTRKMVDSGIYLRSCETLWKDMESVFHFEKGGRILVVGTEEFMYPALFIAGCIEKLGCEVWCHSTTRSPIAVSAEAGYPLRTRYELISMYDPGRVTYIYDIGSYDRVFVITDAQTPGSAGEAGRGQSARSTKDAGDAKSAGENSLVNALKKKNSEIHLIRWCSY